MAAKSVLEDVRNLALKEFISLDFILEGMKRSDFSKKTYKGYVNRIQTFCEKVCENQKLDLEKIAVRQFPFNQLKYSSRWVVLSVDGRSIYTFSLSGEKTVDFWCKFLSLFDLFVYPDNPPALSSKAGEILDRVNDD